MEKRYSPRDQTRPDTLLLPTPLVDPFRSHECLIRIPSRQEQDGRPLRLPQRKHSMKTALSLTLIFTLSSALTTLADSPDRTNGMLVSDYIVAGDGTLDSPDDLVHDVDPCDPSQPDVLS